LAIGQSTDQVRLTDDRRYLEPPTPRLQALVPDLDPRADGNHGPARCVEDTIIDHVWPSISSVCRYVFDGVITVLERADDSNTHSVHRHH